jgi:hypothetical protein
MKARVIGRLAASLLVIAASFASPVLSAGGSASPSPMKDNSYRQCLTEELAKDDGVLSPHKAAVRILLTCTGAPHCHDDICRNVDIDKAATNLESLVLAIRESGGMPEDCARKLAAGQPATGICQVVNQL